jgi:galactoside O-acetyltransferase
MSSFYPENELMSLGFKEIGRNVNVSKNISFYGIENIKIGNNVRIDDFCILSGKVNLGNNIHISAGCYMFAGDAGIEMQDFSGLSSRVLVYAVTDDYSGDFLTNPTVPIKYRNVISQKVILQKYVQIGAGSIILPGVVMGEGSASGAMSLITKSIPPWKICLGIPAKTLIDRKKNLLEWVNKFKLS